MNDAFLDLVRRRYSCRAYTPGQVPREMIERILEAVRLAPSACNRQPWRVAVVTDPALRRRIVDEGFLPGIGMRWAAEAPVLLVLGMARSLVTHTLAPALSGVDYPLLDLGIAGEHAVLQATELGLGTCWIGWIQPRKIRAMVGWSREIHPQAVLTVGWPARPPAGPSPRMAMDEFVTWRETSG